MSTGIREATKEEFHRVQDLAIKLDAVLLDGGASKNEAFTAVALLAANMILCHEINDAGVDLLVTAIKGNVAMAMAGDNPSN